MSSSTTDPARRRLAPGGSSAGPGQPQSRATADATARQDGRSRGGDRILGVDAARGVALLAMMSVHLFPEYSDDGQRHLAHVLVAGRAAAAFALLAGVALVLATARMPVQQARVSCLARALAIGVIGLALGYPDSGLAVILPYYALLFVLAVPLLGLRGRTLAVLGAGVVVAVPVGSHLVRPHLPLPSWENPTFGMVVYHPVDVLTELTITGFYPVLAWTAYLCVGMAVGRADLRSPRVAGWLLAGGTGLAVAASGLSWLLLGPFGGRDAIGATFVDREMLDEALESGLYGTTPTDLWWWLALDSPHSSTPLDLAHTIGTSLALLGAMLLLSRLVRPVPLAAVGAMTLTLYVTHAVLLSTGWLPEDPARSYLLQVAGALVVATAWRATGRRGPAEAAVSALSRAATGRRR